MNSINHQIHRCRLREFTLERKRIGSLSSGKVKAFRVQISLHVCFPRFLVCLGNTPCTHTSYIHCRSRSSPWSALQKKCAPRERSSNFYFSKFSQLLSLMLFPSIFLVYQTFSFREQVQSEVSTFALYYTQKLAQLSSPFEIQLQLVE